MKKYYEEVTNIKGLAILLVLLGHSIIYVPINLMEVEWCKTLYNYIYYFHMPLFFIASGFLYNYSNNYKEYVANKVNRILVPYFIFGTLDLISRNMFPSLMHRDISMIDNIKSILLSGGQYWFLYTLFIIFLIYPIVEKLFKNKICETIFLISVLVISQFNITDLFLFNSVMKYLFYFILGYLVKKNYDDRIKELFSKKKILLITSFMFIVVGLLPNISIIKNIQAIIGCLMSYSFIVSIKNIRIRNVFEDFGKYSLQIYLLNGFLLVPARVITVKAFHIVNPLAVILIIFISNAAIGLIVSKYIIDKVNIFRFLSGIKIKKSTRRNEIATQ
jgi:fucose 4-O-acetylase-like acetyltransferase